MLPKKRILVGAIGATVALTLQTPVSAFIARARTLPTAATASSHRPPSYLAEAFSDAGQRLLGSDRWKGWRAGGFGSALADDDYGSATGHDARVESTLGDVDLASLASGSAASRNGFNSSASGGEQVAHASSVGGGGGGGGAAGIAGAGGGGGGGGGGMSGDSSSGRGASGFNASENGLANGAGLGPLPGHGGTVFHVVPGQVIDPVSGGSAGPVNVESPEPGTLLFLGAGLAGLAARRARRDRSRGESANR
jgi:hypothetical protein